MKGLKIKISDSGNISVWLPYKNGLVCWEIRWGVGNTSYQWFMTSRSELYNPSRVEKAHVQYLKGIGLMRKLERAASANHNWWLLERLREVHKRKLNSYKWEVEEARRLKSLVADCDG